MAMTVSIASIGGVRAVADAAREALQGDSRAWLGGDLCVDAAEPLSESQAAALDQRPGGLDWTLVTTSFTMAASDGVADPSMIFVKAVDPRRYPFYGAVALDPALSLKDALQPDAVAVSSEVLDRLQVRIGDSIRVGARLLRIAAVIKSEPDRFTGQVGGLGLRCIVSRDAYLRTGIAERGNSVKDRVLLRLPPGFEPNQARRILEPLFPGGSIRDFHGALRKQTESVISFLGVTAFLAFGIGAIGVAAALRQHAEDSMPVYAAIKTLGGRPAQVTAIFLFQTGLMTAAAIAAGLPLGHLIRVSILTLAGKYLALPGSNGWNTVTVLEGTCAAILAMAPVLVRPIELIRSVRPSILLRRDRERASSSIAPGMLRWVPALLAIAAIGALAERMLRSLRSTLILACALTAVVVIAVAISVIVLRLLQHGFATKRGLARLAIAGLFRSGNRSATLIAALATALTLMIATFEMSSVVGRAVFDLMPAEGSTLYIAGFKEPYRAPIGTLLDRQPGVESIEMFTQARLRLLSVDGLDYGYLKGEIHTVMCAPASKPSDLTSLTMAEGNSWMWRSRVGSELVFESRDHLIHARVTEIRKFTAAEKFWSNLILDCSSVDPAALLHQAAVRVQPDRIAAVRRAINEAYPTLPVLSADDVSEAIAVVSRDAMTLTRVVAWFTMAAGLSVLIALVAASRGARLQEIAVLTSLGATRATLVKIYTIEFAAIGLISSAIATLLTIGFTVAGMAVVFQRAEAAFDARVALAAIAVAVVATVAAAWIPAAPLLRLKPMEIIRRQGG